MYDDIENLWSEDSAVNVVKTWLVGGTSGQTYTVTDLFLPKLKVDETKYVVDYCDIESKIDEIIGYKHDYKLDDPELPVRAQEIISGLEEFIEKVNANPERYFSRRGNCAKCIHRIACAMNKPDFVMDGYCRSFYFDN
jgi:hypothetical protein